MRSPIKTAPFCVLGDPSSREASDTKCALSLPRPTSREAVKVNTSEASTSVVERLKEMSGADGGKDVG